MNPGPDLPGSSSCLHENFVSSSGESVPRIDSPAKARGEPQFLRDIPIENLWFGAAVRSPFASGRLRGITFDEGFDFERVTVVLPGDIPGENTIAMVKKDMPCLATETIRYLGEPVALVAAPDRETLNAALQAIRPDIEEAPLVAGIDSVTSQLGARPGALENLHETHIEKGDAGKALASADFVIEGEYLTAPQEHAYLEPQAVAALPLAGGKLRILGSLQCPYYVHGALVTLLGASPEDVIVEQTATGGAFGGKEDFPSVIAAYAALLARKSGHPVLIDFDRQLDMEMTTKRHASASRLRVGVDRDGTLRALDAEFILDGGAYITLSPVVLSRGAIHLSGPYEFPAARINGRAVRTNESPAGAFRGFGAPQAHFAIECHMDEIAARMGFDPVEFRRKNLLRPGSVTATGQVLEESVASVECLDWVVSACDYAARKKAIEKQNESDRHVVRGLGVSCFWHGSGFTGSGEVYLASRAALELQRDGTVEILVANTEFGQGALTVLSQITSDACQIPLSSVRYQLPDTSRVPNSGPTVASRTTMVVGKILERCAEGLISELASRTGAVRRDGTGFLLSDGQALSWENAALQAGPIRVEREYERPPGLVWDDHTYRGAAYAVYGWGATATQVAIDRATLEPRCEEIWCAVEIGKAINPREARGQVEGALVQALGWGLFENVTYSARGAVRENRFQTYIIPSCADVPPMHVGILEVPFAHGPQGAKGLGELPMNGLAPALSNAVFHALGTRVHRIPMTPDVILAALEKAGKLHGV